MKSIIKNKAVAYLNKVYKQCHKILIILIILAFISGNIQGASTETITSTTTGLKLDFGENWFNASNGTVGKLDVSGTITADSFSGGNVANWDTAYTERGSQIAGADLTWAAGQLDVTANASLNLIRNSNNNYWTASEANLRLAIFDLNSTNGGQVQVPVSRITLTSTLKVIDNLLLSGYGNASELFLGNGADVDMLDITNQENIIIEKLCLNGNNASNAGTLNLIEITGSSTRNITIQNCYLTNCNAGSIIDCEEDTSYININNNYFSDIEPSATHPGGVWLSGTHCIVSDNYFVDCYGSGVVLECASDNSKQCEYHLIDNNIITGFTSHGIHMEGNSSGGVTRTRSKAINCTITNNHIFDLTGNAYGAGDPSTGLIIREGTVCDGNRVENVWRGMMISGNNTVVSDNVFKHCEDYGIMVADNPGWHHKIIFDGNTIEDIWGNPGRGFELRQDETKAKAYSQFPLDNTIKISDCIIRDTAGQGIRGYVDFLEVSDTTFEDIGDDAIDLDSPSGDYNDNLTVTGCIFRRIGDDAIKTINSSIIANNRFYDVTDICINIIGATDSIVTGNIAEDSGTFLDFDGASDYTIYTSNNYRGCNTGILNPGGNDVNASNIYP